MATQTNGNEDILRKNLLRSYAAYDETVKFPKWKALCGDVVPTSQLYERVALISDVRLPEIRSEFGLAPVGDIRQITGGQYQAQKRLLQLRMSDEAFINDQYGIVKGYGAKLKAAFDNAKEYAAAVYLNGAYDSTVISTLLGEALASSSHALESGTDTNVFSTAQALGYLALEQASAALMAQLSHKGTQAPKYGPFQLEVHTKKALMAGRLISGPERPGTADREKNALAGDTSVKIGQITDVVASPFFANTEWWALRAIPQYENPRFCLSRYPFKQTALEYMSGNDAWVVTAKEAYTFVQADYRGTFYSNPN